MLATMAAVDIQRAFDGVDVYTIVESSPPQWKQLHIGVKVELITISNEDAFACSVLAADGSRDENVLRANETSPPFARLGERMVSVSGMAVHSEPGNLRVTGVTKATAWALTFPDAKAANAFCSAVSVLASDTARSAFDEKTDKASAQQYFHYYGQLAQQQNMLQDLVRTGTYKRSMIDNFADFQDAVVLDVGTGSGILSHFALHAGAKKVYAVEASNMAETARRLGEENGFKDKLIVVKGKVEEVELPEQVDIIISEPMGILLINERMLESYIHARKWLKPGGNMFPTTGIIFYAPFQDDYLHMETFSKASFWGQHHFYGVNMQGLHDAALDEYYGTPIVDAIDPRLLLTMPLRHDIDFLTCTEADLADITLPVRFTVAAPCTIHGLAFWFDVTFNGTLSQVVLSTGPYAPLTHWYQVRCQIRNPLMARAGDTLVGKVIMTVNKRQSYDITMDLELEGTGHKACNVLNLKDPFYRCSEYAGAAAQSAGAGAAQPNGNGANQDGAEQEPADEMEYEDAE